MKLSTDGKLSRKAVPRQSVGRLSDYEKTTQMTEPI